MTAQSTAIDDPGPTGRELVRRIAFFASAIFGASAGVLLGDVTIAALGTIWARFLYPAYDEMIRNGLLAWCM